MMTFYSHKNDFKASHKVFLTLLIVMLTSFPFVLALEDIFEFDNIESFDETIGDYGKYTIRNSVLRIPILQLDKVIELELKNNSDICEGFTCYADKEIILYEDGILINDIKFLHTKKDGTQYYDNLDYGIFIMTGEFESETVNDFERQCVNGKFIDGVFDPINKTTSEGYFEQVCTNVLIGTHQEETEIRIKYNLGDKVSAGNYTIRLDGKLPDIFTTIDWQIKSNGFWTLKWAEWTSGLNVDLTAYWDMQNTTATLVPDLTGNGFDGNIIGNLNVVAGNLNNALYGSGWNATNYVNITQSGMQNFNTSVSLMAWINLTGATPTNPPIISLGGFAGLDIGFASDNFSTIKRDFTIDVRDNRNISNNSWHHVVTIIEADGNTILYVDGVNNVNGTANAYLGLNHTTMGHSSSRVTDTTWEGYIDEIGVWNRTLTDQEVQDLYNSGAGITFQGVAVSVTLNSPDDDVDLLAGVQPFNAEVRTNSSLRIVNVTLHIWNSTNLVNFTTNFTIETGILNISNYSLSVNLPVLDNYTWNFFGCSNTTTGDPCQFSALNRSFEILDFVENSQTFNLTTVETAAESYIINISTDGSNPVSADLIYNGTLISGTQSGTDAESIFTANQILPADVGNKTFFWNITVGAITSESIIQNQNVSDLIFNLCNATLSTTYINFTFKNETLSQEDVNATISSTFIYWLGDGSENKTLTLINATENPTYGFCTLPTDKPLNVNFDVAYNNDISQQRINADTLLLTNITTDRVLYLLPSSLGIFTTFRTQDTVANILSGVLGVITTTLGGSTITVGSDTTDSSGIAVYFLNPDSTYTGTFTLTGFTTNIFTFVPIADTRTVIMGGVADAVTNGTDISLNMSYQTFPINSSLTNNTDFTFGLNVTSQQPITLISMNITNQTGHQVGFQSSAGQGFISEIINTINNSRMQGRFIIQTANETIEFVRVWNVGLDFAGDYSLFNQGNLFLDYNFREFSRLIIVLFIIMGMMAFLTTTQITDTSESQIGAILTTAGGVFFIMRRLFIRKL